MKLQREKKTTYFVLTAFGPEIINVLISEGYPDSYPRNFDNTSTYSIPEGLWMNIFFHDFDVEYTPDCKLVI